MSQSGDSHEPVKRRPTFGLATLLVAVTAIAIGIAIWLEWSTTDATAYILVKEAAPDAMAAWAGESGGASAEQNRAFRRTQMETLRSKAILIRALRDQTIMSLGLGNGLGWLEANLRVDNPQDSDIIRITLRDRDPDKAVKVVNAVVDAYFKVVVEEEFRRRDRTEREVDMMYRETQDQILSERESLVKLQQTIGDEAGTSPSVIVKEAEIKRLEGYADQLFKQLMAIRATKRQPSRIQRYGDAIASP
ncbi:MAG: hypothetical protein HYX69_18770 [Planctomycetia bacterium]|nr:hypothetical protein [Planctomycetia bacterium]